MCEMSAYENSHRKNPDYVNKGVGITIPDTSTTDSLKYIFDGINSPDLWMKSLEVDYFFNCQAYSDNMINASRKFLLPYI